MLRPRLVLPTPGGPLKHGTVAVRSDITEVEIIDTPTPGDQPSIRVVRVVAGGQEYVYDWYTPGGSFIKTNFPNGKEPIN